MSKLQILLYNGAINPSQEKHDWGTQGPLIRNIEMLQFIRGNFYIHFENNPDYFNEAFSLTDWKHLYPPVHGVKKPCLEVNFPDKLKELIGCIDPESGNLMYYQDCVVSQSKPDSTMQMRISMERNYGNLFPPDERQLVIIEIASLYFQNGTYSVCFTNNGACQEAAAITGWKTGMGNEFSLLVPFHPSWKSILTYRISMIDAKHQLYSRFELLPE